MPRANLGAMVMFPYKTVPVTNRSTDQNFPTMPLSSGARPPKRPIVRFNAYGVV